MLKFMPKHKIRELEATVADAHKETIRVRNYWFQVLEDMLLELEATRKKADRKLVSTSKSIRLP